MPRRSWQLFRSSGVSGACKSERYGRNMLSPYDMSALDLCITQVPVLWNSYGTQAWITGILMYFATVLELRQKAKQ